MSDPILRRKQIRHFNEPGQAHELTFSCYRRLPLLTNDTWRKMLSLSVDRAIQKHPFDLLAFVYMPEHVHVIVFPQSPTAQVHQLLYAIKRPFSLRIKKALEDAQSPLLEGLTVHERPGKVAFRFWQEGAGYDRNLTSLESVRAAIEYIHLNPVRRRLCQSPDQWKWSSWRHYHVPEGPDDPDLPRIFGPPL